MAMTDPLSAARMLAWLVLACACLIFGEQRTALGEQLEPPATTPIQLEIGKGTLVRLERPANQVFIANPEIADVQVKSPRLVYVFGKAPGETTVYAVDASDEVMLSRDVVVTHNLGRLRETIHAAAPDADISVRSLHGNLMLEGKVRDASTAETIRTIATQFLPPETVILNYLTVGAPNQVNIRVRVAEMSRDTAKKLGFNLDIIGRETLSDGGRFFGSLVTGNPLFLAGTAATRPPTPGAAVDGIFPGQFSLAAINAGGDRAFQAMIEALEQEGMLTMLAEPNLTALSGEVASFLVGGEFPVPVAQRDDRVTIDFKQFGIMLDFRPVVIGGDRISLRVRPEVSELSDEGAIELANFEIPGIQVRRAETTVELGSGESFAIAGLLSDSVNHDLRKFPFLGDIPILGALFRSDTFVRQETDLVIIVTPYLVQPVATRLATPLDGYHPPNDVARYVEGERFKQGYASGSRETTLRNSLGLTGPSGYVLN